MKFRWKGFVVPTICLVLAATLLFGKLSAGALDLTQNCSLTLYPCNTDTEELREWASDLQNLQIDIYKVADMQANTAGGNISFVPAEGSAYASLASQIAAANSAESYLALAQSAAALTIQNTPGKTEKLIPSTKTIIAGGTADGLTAGIYLVIPHDLHAKYMEVNNDQITTTACVGNYKYSYAPEIIAVPLTDAKTHSWNYSPVAVLKPTRTERYGKIEIEKQLTAHRVEEPAMFVFSIEAVYDGDVVYSDVAALTYTAGDNSGTKSVIVDKIPAGAVVTVTEVYSGSSYTLTTAKEQSAVVSAEVINKVTFTNKPTNDERGGHGALNHFNKDEDGWHWVKSSDSTPYSASPNPESTPDTTPDATPEPTPEAAPEPTPATEEVPR